MDIVFAGGSHYNKEGFESLKPYFERIYVVDCGIDDLRPLLRSSDIVVGDIEEAPCNDVFLCGYKRIISKNSLSKKRYINVHGSLLPKYRGMHSTFYAIMNGERELGITFHVVNQYIDAGDIISQFSFEYNGECVLDINKKIDSLVALHAGKTIFDYLCGRIIPIKQDESKATFCAKRNIEDCLIDFNMPNVLIRRFFKALTPSYPYPMVKIRNENYEILPETTIIDREYVGPTGRVVFIDEKGTWIKTKQGFLVVNKVRKYGSIIESLLCDMVPLGHRFEQKATLPYL